MSSSGKGRTTQFLQEAYALDSDRSMQTFYENWADEYDTQLEDALDYLSPTNCAALFMRHVSERNSEILDIGCGTGLTSVDLAADGYAPIDGLDFSAAMLRKAGERGFYRSLFEADLNQPLQIASDKYDAAISTGTFTHGHVGADPLDEIFRILKPGAVFACTIHEDVWHDHGFDQKLDALIADKVINILELERGVFFEGGKEDALYYALKKV
ncbi:MAG: class I SAM-dependent methyltransferase [Pseudomonadota bacterium]